MKIDPFTAHFPRFPRIDFGALWKGNQIATQFYFCLFIDTARRTENERRENILHAILKLGCLEDNKYEVCTKNSITLDEMIHSVYYYYVNEDHTFIPSDHYQLCLLDSKRIDLTSYLHP